MEFRPGDSVQHYRIVEKIGEGGMGVVWKGYHEQDGTDVLLFARLRQSERAFWFLGPATYVRHTGERPMAVVWRLRYPLSGDLYSSFAAAVA